MSMQKKKKMMHAQELVKTKTSKPPKKCHYKNDNRHFIICQRLFLYLSTYSVLASE